MNPLTSLRPTRSEAGLSAALFTALALTIYLPHIVNGGWYNDDWIVIARMSEVGGLPDSFTAMNAETFRPGLALSLSVFHQIVGGGHAGYLVIGALLAAIQGWLFYLVLRTLRLSIVVAAVAAAIFIVLPVIDATRLWLSAYPIQVAGVLYLLGTLIALHGLERASGRRAIAWHAGTVALFFCAVLTYELIAGLIAVTAILYLVQSGWRPALRRWIADLGAIGVALLILAPRAAADRDANSSLSFLWDRATQTLPEGEMVFRWLLPFHDVFGGQLGLLLLIVGMLGAGIAIGRRSEAGVALAAWAKIAGLAAIFALAGLVMLLPADPYFVPRISGMGNRTGAFAAFGAVLLLIALIVLALGGLGALLRRPRAGFAIAAVFVLVTGLNLAAREYRQQGPWADAWQQEQQTLAGIDRALGGSLPPNTGLVSFGHTTFILPADVSVFAYDWDLRGALWGAYEERDVEAQPWDAAAVCGPEGLIFPSEVEIPTGERRFGYDRLIFANASTQIAARVPSRRACEAAVAANTG